MKYKDMKYKIEQIIVQYYAGKDRLISLRNYHRFVVKKRVWYGWKPVTWASDYNSALHYVDCELPKSSKDKD